MFRTCRQGVVNLTDHPSRRPERPLTLIDHHGGQQLTLRPVGKWLIWLSYSNTASRSIAKYSDFARIINELGWFSGRMRRARTVNQREQGQAAPKIKKIL